MNNKPPAFENPLSSGEKTSKVRSMFDSIAPRYDLLNRLLTFRLDVTWRRKTIKSLLLSPGSKVIDLACGTGDFCRDLQRVGHLPIGIDLSWGMLKAAQTQAPLIHGDALKMPFAEKSFEGATCGFALRNFEALPPFFIELARILRPGGRIGLLEVDQPSNSLLRTGHKIYFDHLVPFIGGLLSSRSAYQYLPKSVVYLPSDTALRDQLAAAGFTDISKIPLSGGIAQLWSATRSNWHEEYSFPTDDTASNSE